MSVNEKVLTFVVDGSHDWVKHFNQEEIIAEFHLSEDFDDLSCDVSLMNTSLCRKKRQLSVSNFVSMCMHRKYSFEILYVYFNNTHCCIIGQLSNKHGYTIAEKVCIETYVNKVVYK